MAGRESKRGRSARAAVAPPGRNPLTPQFDPYGRRDSDVSFCSSIPSSAGSRAPAGPTSALLSDRSSQNAALKHINAYLSSFSLPFSLKPPLPSAREITQTLRYLLSRLDLPFADLESDLPSVLRALACPLKLTKSALKSPGTPHAWPPLLSAIYWLVQLVRSSEVLPDEAADLNELHLYTIDAYHHFITGDDDAEAALDREYLQKAEHEAAKAAASVEDLERTAADLELKVRALSSAPSRKAALEDERTLLMEDVKKFQKVVDSYEARVAEMQSRIGERETELDAKEMERRRICEDNAELRKRVADQQVSSRDAERMKKEIQAIERDIAEAEIGRSAMEEKSWELDSEVGRKLKELEALAEQSNHAIRKLKLGIDFQYMLDLTGSSPSEVISITHKTILKPQLTALSEDTKKTSIVKREELITLQQKLLEQSAMSEERRKHLAALETEIMEGQVRLSSLKKEREEYTSNCAVEAEKIGEEFTRKEQQLIIVEKEVQDFLKVSVQKHLDAVRETEEENQKCARGLLELIEVVSEYKESMESTFSWMKNSLIETVRGVEEKCKAFRMSKIASRVSNLTHGGLNRERGPSPSSDHQTS